MLKIYMLNKWYLFLLLVSLGIFFLSKQVIFNPTISVPQGYYFTYPVTDYMKNDLVLFCVTDEHNLAIMHKLHLPYANDACPHNAPFLMKYIVAEANDEIEITPLGVSVNGYLYANSVSFSQYKNVNLYPLRQGKFKLHSDEFFVLGGSIHSYEVNLVCRKPLYTTIKAIFNYRVRINSAYNNFMLKNRL